MYIIVPGTIWGAGTGIPFDKGLSNPHSVQIPAAIKLSLKRGQAGVMGDGEYCSPLMHDSLLATSSWAHKSAQV